jgi:integrase
MSDRGDGYLYQRGRTWWLGYYHHGRYVRESLGTTDQDAAEKLRKKRLKLVNTPHFVDPGTQRLRYEDLADAYLRDLRLNRRRSLRDAERYVRQLGATFGSDRALDITPTRIEAYKEARLAEGVAPATVNRDLQALRRMFSIAVKANRLPYRPHIALLDESDNVREGFLDPADFEAVADGLPTDVADAARFAYLVGWRRGEVLTLEWRDVQLERSGTEITGGTIRLRATQSKNRRGRVIVLRDELLALIARRAHLRRLDCVHVFHRDGKPLRDFRISWRKAVEAAGVAGRLFHDLRRSAVRNMVRAGVPERVAMAIAGHRTRSIFDRYNIVSESDVGDAIGLTSAYVTQETEKAPRVKTLG